MSEETFRPHEVGGTFADCGPLIASSFAYITVLKRDPFEDSVPLAFTVVCIAYDESHFSVQL
jgi:hypothetical protein